MQLIATEESYIRNGYSLNDEDALALAEANDLLHEIHTTELRGSLISRKKAIEKVNELYKERVADYTEAFHDDFNNEKASDSFILEYNDYETMCEVNIVEQELDETLYTDD